MTGTYKFGPNTNIITLELKFSDPDTVCPHRAQDPQDPAKKKTDLRSEWQSSHDMIQHL